MKEINNLGYLRRTYESSSCQTISSAQVGLEMYGRCPDVYLLSHSSLLFVRPRRTGS